MAGDLTLVLGHAGSGKSLWAEGEVQRLGGDLTYIATARLWDDEIHAKRDAHAARRGDDWTLVEEPIDLAGVCGGLSGAVLIDCATMWLTNHVMDEADWQAGFGRWLAAMRAAPARFVVVSNDVGGGITPDNAMARAFQADQGALNQRLAAEADHVVLVTAGLPQVLK
jgi:adenosylcobinamide kinase/adenosylcobinamide-phosphate guanylyltransferase